MKNCLSNVLNLVCYFGYGISTYTGAEPETIDRGCPVQINRIFGSKEILFFIIRPLFFSEPRGCPSAGWRLPWIRPCTYITRRNNTIVFVFIPKNMGGTLHIFSTFLVDFGCVVVSCMNLRTVCNYNIP
jgi:hypothetical protein